MASLSPLMRDLTRVAACGLAAAVTLGAAVGYLIDRRLRGA